MNHKIYFTPGPSQIYYTVPDHLKSALKEDVMCISHRGEAFQKIVETTKASLRQLLNIPDDYEIFVTSSANQIWERIIQNLVMHSSHHFINGSFAKKFYQFALDYQKDSTKTLVNDGAEFTDLTVPSQAELISVTLNETSIGYGFDMEKLKELRANYPDKLIALDAVSALPSVELDLSLVDTAYFSVQKCFGLPAGLGVWMVNKRCFEQYEQVKAAGFATGSYHDLATLKTNGDKNETPETPNILGIYLLGKVCEDLLFRGKKMIENDTIYKATILYQALEANPKFNPFIASKATRSKTVIVAECEGGNSGILEVLANNGFIVGKGYGAYKTDHMRIANFPTHSKEQVEMICDLIAKY